MRVRVRGRRGGRGAGAPHPRCPHPSTGSEAQPPRAVGATSWRRALTAGTRPRGRARLRPCPDRAGNREGQNKPSPFAPAPPRELGLCGAGAQTPASGSLQPGRHHLPSGDRTDRLRPRGRGRRDPPPTATGRRRPAAPCGEGHGRDRAEAVHSAAPRPPAAVRAHACRQQAPCRPPALRPEDATATPEVTSEVRQVLVLTPGCPHVRPPGPCCRPGRGLLSFQIPTRPGCVRWGGGGHPSSPPAVTTPPDGAARDRW